MLYELQEVMKYFCLLTKGVQEAVVKVIPKESDAIDIEHVKPPVIIDHETGQFILHRRSIGALFIYHPVEKISTEEFL